MSVAAIHQGVRGRLIAWRVLLCAVGTLGSPAGCQKPQVDPPSDQPSGLAEAPTASEETPPPAARPRRVSIGFEVNDPDQWLFVEKTRGKADGGWATGLFIPDRNKLVVDTKDVERFAIHVARIPIDWERLVVLRIDGVNTELRKRDLSVYHFEVDEHGQWVVTEN